MNANESMRVKRWLILISALSLVTGSMAANYTVYMESYGFFEFRFNPSYLEIQVGDTVTWRNEDYTEWGYYGYDATCYSGSDIIWSTGCVYPGESPSITFPYVDTYYYEDSYYGAYGMTGHAGGHEWSASRRWTGDAAGAAMAPDRAVPMRGQQPGGRHKLRNAGFHQPADWDNLVTNTAAASVETFTDTPPAASRLRFYRAAYLL